MWGKSPRTHVTLTFGQGAWITAEHAATYVGAPILSPVLVTGLGFVPRSQLTFRIGDQVVRTIALTGDRHEIRRLTVEHALGLLLGRLREDS